MYMHKHKRSVAHTLQYFMLQDHKIHLDTIQKVIFTQDCEVYALTAATRQLLLAKISLHCLLNANSMRNILTCTIFHLTTRANEHTGLIPVWPLNCTVHAI